MKKMNWLGLILALVMCLALVPAQAETMEVMESESYSVSSPYSNDELFAAYVQGEMDKTVYGDAAMFGTLGRSKLTTEASCKLYDAVKAMIVDIAAGERSSTAYSIDLEALGFKTEYTNADIGVDAIFEVNGENWTVLPDAKTKLDAIRSEMLEEMGLSNGKLVNALLQDCPYELYWFKKNKPIGDEYGGFAYANGAGYSIYGSTHTYTFKNFNLSFAVAKEFGYGYAVDTSTTGAAAAAISNAQAIVDRYEHLSDEDKLLAYKNEICNLTSYNDAAADDSTNTPYGNPWQLIWVFDGNSSTTVVCEGYSKAFAYLCDLSEFDSKIFCYTVSGEMNGGAHMWNIVQTPDGNYLVDVTNCDSDMIGNPNNLYMVSDANGTWNTTYRIAIEGQATVSYTYDSDTISMWGEEVLKLGEKHTHSWKPVSYTWSGTYGACSATRKCDCGESETVFAVVQQTVKQEGSCKDVGINTYTATFSADWASTQTKDVETGIAITNHVGGSEQRNQKPATCSENGYTGDVYCLGCGGLIGKGLTTPATGEHSYTASAYTWNADQTECVATGVCGACGAETSANAEVTEEQILAPTCGKDGEKKITARFDESWAEEQSVTVAIPATGAHVYGEVSYDWADDLSACTASHACGCEYTETAEAKVTSEITTAATCVAKGEKTYTATFDKEWATTQTKTEAIEKDAANHTGETELRGKVDATCGADGYTGDTYCLGCGNKLEDGEALPATGEHNYADEVPDTRVPATCMATGSVTMQCTGCNATEEQTLPIDPDKHTGNTTTKNASEATCGEAGYTGDTVCECGKKLETGEPIPATGDHKYTVEVEGSREAATCKDAGSVTMQCENCDATEEQTLPVDPTNHTGDTEVRNAKAPDCANDGYTGDTHCLGCGEKLETGEPLPATGKHNFASEVAGTRVDATCMAEGSVTMQCTGCDAAEVQTLEKDPDNHTGNNTTVGYKAPTCGEAGYTGDTVCECGKKVGTGESIPATGDHKYTVEVEGSREAATCKDAGSVTMQCENCEATEEQTLPVDPTNHTGDTEVRNAKAPDCANDGYTGDTYCLGCNAKIKDGETISATGEHNFASEVAGTRVDATCMTKGSVTMQCTGCDATEEQTLPIDRFNHTGNTTTENAAEPTCGAEGYTGDTYCECGMVIKMGQPIPATEEHDFTEIVEGSEVTPTCKTEGSLTLKCANCEATSVDKLGYDPANHEGGTELRNAKAPDCANAGYTGDTHCLGCGEKLKDGEPIPANGEHSYTIEVEGTRIPSTCKTPGKVTMQCSGCTDTEEQTLPVDPANHEGETEVRGAKEATCTEDGYTGDLYCLDCETVIEEGEAIPAGHEDEDGDGICDNCPAVLAYRIDIAPSEGGSASASSEKAAAGEEVIITLTPEDGMEMEYLVVVLADGRTITPRLVSENRYTFIQPEGDVTVHAFFKALPVDPKVTVTFHANGGVGVMMPVQVTSGQPYTLPECAFLPAEGYAFKGWALTADGPVLPQSVTVGGSIDLYAIWQLEGASVPVPPATGDNANINLWLVMMALSAACIVYLLTGRKRKV